MEPIIRDISKLRELADHPLDQPETNILMKALFAQVLISIRDVPARSNAEVYVFSDITQKTLALINQNIAGNLSVSELASSLHISVSQLAHVFKKDLHISIHKYILEKRLILANKKIKSSIPPLRLQQSVASMIIQDFIDNTKKCLA